MSTYWMVADVEGTRDGVDDDLQTIHNDDWRDAVDAGELRVHEGDLALDGDLDASGAALIVRGNLAVSGTVALDETGSLVVTGDLRCKNLCCEGNLEVQGDAHVVETIFGFYEAGISSFEGAVTATLFVEGNHAFEYDEAKLAVTHHLGFSNFHELHKGTPELARQVLSDAALAKLSRLMAIGEGSSDGVEKLLRTQGFLR